MGSGGVQASCQCTFCILAGIALGLALLSLLCGIVLYRVSSTFTNMSNTHVVKTTTASNITKGMGDKPDDICPGSAKTGADLMEKANKLFYSAGGLGIAAVTFLIFSCVVACTSLPELAPPTTSDLYAPAPYVDPSAPPGEDAEGGATSPVPPVSSPIPPGSPPPPGSPLPSSSPSPPGSPLPPPASPIPDRAISPTA